MATPTAQQLQNRDSDYGGFSTFFPYTFTDFT